MLPFIAAMPAIISDDPVLTSNYPTLHATNNYGSAIESPSFSHNVILPTGSTNSNYIVLLVDAFTPGPAFTLNTPSGWTLQWTGSYSANKGRRGIYTRQLTSVTPSVTFTGSESFSIYTNSYRFSNVSGITLATASATSTNPNPPSLIVPVDWGPTPHSTWLAVGMKSVGTPTAPSGYSNKIDSNVLVQVSSARKNAQINSDDPGAFSWSSSQPWHAHTIAIRGPLI